MSHLTEEQFEDVLQGCAQASEQEHMDWCPECRARLKEKRALARRMSAAFSSVQAASGLANRIRAQIAAARPAKTQPRIIGLHARRQRVWSALAIAAIIMVVVTLRISRIDPSAHVRAAQVELVGLHRINLNSRDSLMADEGHPQSCNCACMQSRSGKGQAMPCCQRGLCLGGCQERQFQGRLVGCCVIRQPNASAISVFVIPQAPEALGMTPAPTTTASGQAIWQASCGSCNMASVRMGQESYCVIGQVPQEDLVALLKAFEL